MVVGGAPVGVDVYVVVADAVDGGQAADDVDGGVAASGGKLYSILLALLVQEYKY